MTSASGGTDPEGMFTLEGGERLNGMGTTDCFARRFRHAEVFYLAFLNQFLYSTRNIFDRNFRSTRC